MPAPPPPPIAAVRDFLADCATANLVDVPEKGKVFSFNAEAAARIAAALGVPGLQPNGRHRRGHTGRAASLGPAAVHKSGRQGVRTGRHNHGPARAAKAAPATARAQVPPAQGAPPAAHGGA